MPDWLASILPGVLSGLASGLLALGAMREQVKSLFTQNAALFERVKGLEGNILELVRSLGRIEGRLCTDAEERKEKR